MPSRCVVCENGWVGRCGLPVGEWMITPWGASRIVKVLPSVVRSEDNGGMVPLFPEEGN